MTRPIRHALFLAPALAFVFAIPATAQFHEPAAKLHFELLEGRGGVYAIMTVESTYGFDLTGTLDLWVNGNAFKLDPVETSSVEYVLEIVGTGNDQLSACASLSALATVYGDQTVRVETDRCDDFTPKPELQPVRILQPPTLARSLRGMKAPVEGIIATPELESAGVESRR